MWPLSADVHETYWKTCYSSTQMCSGIEKHAISSICADMQKSPYVTADVHYVCICHSLSAWLECCKVVMLTPLLSLVVLKAVVVSAFNTSSDDKVVIGLILSLHPANERRHYKVTPSLIGWEQT